MNSQDSAMSDRGFVISNELKELHHEDEVKDSQSTASVRIHVEHVILRAKKV